jgi:hypothetical protein
MANTLIPVEERELTPAQVDALDRRRRRGQTLIVVGCQALIIATIVTLWAGQDATYSPGWAHPMLYWDLFLFTAALSLIGTGIQLRKGMNEFFSY